MALPQELVRLTAKQQALSEAAWRVRNHSHLYGSTAVGCALTAADGSVIAGCNVEHRYRSHDVHAEVNTLTTMVSLGHASFVSILIAADREHFTPCGACLDWIIQFGGLDAEILVQGEPDSSAATRYLATDLMPFYPR